ncbi:UNVERIFIED_CONTAM: hypothetical protein Sradi_2399300 [Sesamum radiatum]|uniref:Uncharacterized protein n=1 Tax=Sesamum radiatum TaxID=300843 RepID=A0AAW2SH27_SESRA
MVDPGTPFTTAKGCAGAEMNPSPGLVAAIESDSQAGDKLIPFNNRRKFPKSSKATGRHAGQCGVLDLPRKKDKSFRKKGDKNNLVGKHQIAEKGDGCGARALGGVESHLTAGNETLSDLVETGDLSNGSSGPAINFQLPSVGRGINMFHQGMHGCFVTTAKNGGGYPPHLQIKLKKQTVDGN